MRFFPIFIFLLHTGMAYSQTQVPNEFQAGEPAKASEVNENFDALEAAVDTNAASIETNATAISGNTATIGSLTVNAGVYVFSQGTAIGQFLTASKGANIYVLTDEGFIFQIGTRSEQNYYLGTENRIYFSETTCSGTAYIVGDYDTQWASALGLVFRADPASPSTFYYTARGGQPSLENYGSFTDNNQCYVEAGSDTLFAVFPNDPLVTGVSNTAPALPLTIGLP